MSDFRPNGRNEEAFLPNLGPLYPRVEAPTTLEVVDFRLPALDETVALSGRFNGADTLRDALGVLPRGLDAYFSYIDNFGGFPELLAMRAQLNPLAVYVSITIFGGHARVADMEPGAMGIGEFGHWYDNTADHSQGLPIGYTSAGNMESLIQAANGRPFIRWSAHYGLGPHVCAPHVCGFPAADFTQWNDHGPLGQNYDPDTGPGVTLARLRPGPPKPTTSYRYERYDNRVRTELKDHPAGTERQVVEAYDKLRAKSKLSLKEKAQLGHLEREAAWYRDRLGHLVTANGTRKADCRSKQSVDNHWCWRYYRLERRATGLVVQPDKL